MLQLSKEGKEKENARQRSSAHSLYTPTNAHLHLAMRAPRNSRSPIDLVRCHRNRISAWTSVPAIHHLQITIALTKFLHPAANPLRLTVLSCVAPGPFSIPYLQARTENHWTRRRAHRPGPSQARCRAARAHRSPPVTLWPRRQASRFHAVQQSPRRPHGLCAEGNRQISNVCPSRHPYPKILTVNSPTPMPHCLLLEPSQPAGLPSRPLTAT